MRTYYLRSFGCQMNEHDAERIRFALEGEGLVGVATPDEAAVLVYNTCTVRKSADERLAGHLSEAARLKLEDPERIVLVTGCLPQAEQEAFFARFPVCRRRPGAAERPPPAGAAACGRGARRRPPRLLRRRPPAERRAARPAGASPPGLGADHVGLHQLLFVLHRAARPRPGAQPRAGGGPCRSAGARRGRRPGGHPARPERQRVRPRSAPRGRGRLRLPSPSARLTGRRSPHPLHDLAPEGPLRRPHRGRRDAGLRLRACAPAAAVRLGRDPRGDETLIHGRGLSRTRGRPARRGARREPHDRPHRGVPR